MIFKDNQRRLISLNLTYSGVFIKGFPNYHSLSEPVPEHINESGVGKHFTFMCYIAGLLHTDMPAWMRIHSTPTCAQIASWRIVIQLAVHWKPPRHLQNKPRQARHDCVYTTWWSSKGFSCLFPLFCWLNLWAPVYLYIRLSSKNKPRFRLGCCVTPARWGFWRTAEDDDEARLHHLSLSLQASANCCLILFESKVSTLSCIASLPCRLSVRHHVSYEWTVRL